MQDASGAHTVGMACSRLAVCVALVAPALLTLDASASNKTKPRTPVEWPTEACMDFVDRSADPVYSFSYDIPREDPSPGEPLTSDEVADSRRHQFFAMCHQRSPQQWPPVWIDAEDVQAAIDKGLINDDVVEDDEVLPGNPYWGGGCALELTDKRPITNAMADSPVEWDTTGIDAGGYTLWGYTWEPAFNVWWPRTGHIVVVHDGNPEAAGPAGAVTNTEVIVEMGQSAAIEGCAVGPAGTTVTGYFASTDGNTGEDWDPPWAPFSDTVELSDGTFSLDFVAPTEVAGDQVLIRVDIETPDGTIFEAHMTTLVSVLAGGQSGGCDEGSGGGFIGNPGCGGDDSSGGSTGTDSGDDSTSTSAAGTTTGEPASSGSSGSGISAGGSGGGSGGGCRVGGSGPFSLLLLGLLGLVRRRR